MEVNAQQATKVEQVNAATLLASFIASLPVTNDAMLLFTRLRLTMISKLGHNFA